jgi:hypothetical protein
MKMTPTIAAKITIAAIASNGQGLKDFGAFTAARAFGGSDATGRGGGIEGATADGTGGVAAGAAGAGTSSFTTFLPITSTD